MRAAQLHRRRRRQLLVPAAVVGAALATGSARAASTWDGGGTIDNFSDANNWADNLAPTSPLTFDGSVRLTPLNDLNTSAADWGITFAATAGAFTISGGGTSATGAVLRIGTITNSSANAQVMNLDYRLNGTRTIDSGAAGLTVRTIGSTSGTSGRTITKNGAGTLTVNGFGGQASGLMSYAITNGTVEFANATNATLSGLISGVGNLTKSGAGTTILSNAANTYSGTTAVNGGTLLVDGAHNGAGNYTVGAGGTLGGIGAINLVAASNIITVNGTLVPGSATAIESLDIGVGDLALAGTANFQIDLTAATFDDVNLSLIHI